MKRCSCCILWEDFPNITFDEKGVCNYCRAWDRQWKNFNYAKAEKTLLSLFGLARAKKHKYDCLIPFSGGRDSSYVVYLCKHKYKLNPLVVTYNNLFMSEYSLHNIFSTVQQLNIDHVFLTYAAEDIKAFYRTMVKCGGEFCSICTAGINYATIVYQRYFNIPLVIYGTSTRTDEQSPFEVTCTHPIYIRKVLSQNNFEPNRIDAFLVKRPNEFSAFDKAILKLKNSDFMRINLPDYIPWNNHDIQNTLKHELKWQTPDSHADHIDCKYASIKYYLKNKQIPHYIFKQEKYSQLIRDGQMTREQALISLNNDLLGEYIEPPQLQSFMDFLGLTKEDLEFKENRSHLNYVTKDELIERDSIYFKSLSVPWQIYKRIFKKI